MNYSTKTGWNSTSTKSQLIRPATNSHTDTGDKNICHHCKFIGPPEFFYRCTQKFICGKNKHSEDIQKAFFNLKNGLSASCDKKYCLYCVKNCYLFPLKKGDQKTWVCPFCTVSLLGRLLLHVL